MRGSIKFAINISLRWSDGRPTQVTPQEDVDQRVFCETKDAWLEWIRCEDLSKTTTARCISSLYTFRRIKLWKMWKDILVWSPNAPAFSTKLCCFWDTWVKVKLHACTSFKIKLWEHKVIFFTAYAHFIILQHVEELLSVQMLPTQGFWFMQLPVFTTQLPGPHERDGWSGALIAYWAFGACFSLTLLTHLTLSGWKHVGKWQVVACTSTGQALTNHSILFKAWQADFSACMTFQTGLCAVTVTVKN